MLAHWVHHYQGNEWSCMSVVGGPELPLHALAAYTEAFQQDCDD